ncbi:MAG: hypothetical protein AUJ74_03570 [Candidatus Omnitrophica bacterium CG1_02_44_16]|nr:MAG: hypothetical protein AUJ74_03570 [Candidatus Omnitrophica bacterium CG1_02_44_16]PIY82634.1 MAG: hypothetical protein COY78_05905 [Candidatus Omnitrophica bacterium CG_4_10_14_0_8_um_filter_44_12]PIZ84012.1 MAG: hypothetical protein COX96_06025 [Candidatus Omnitrophica bacterium CG_4_10_14_0_2_um_filter_44_9]
MPARPPQVLLQAKPGQSPPKFICLLFLSFFAATFDFSQSSFRNKGIQAWKHLDGEVSEPVLAKPTGEFRSRRSPERSLASKNRQGARKRTGSTKTS